MSVESQWLDSRHPAPGSVGTGPIGAYFTQEHLHLVQLERLADGTIELSRRESVAYPGSREELMASPAAVRKLLRRAVRAGKFRGKKVVSAMPPEQVRVMSVSYPASASGSAANSIAKLMSDRVDGALTDYVIDYVPIRMSLHDGDRLALVAISRLEHTKSYLDSLTSAGLYVEFLEIEPLAIKRLITFGPAADQRDHVFVVKVDQTTSNVTTISGERLLADQEIQVGEELILDAIASSLNLSPSVTKDLVMKNGLDPRQTNIRLGDSTFDLGVTATLVEIVRPAFLKLVREIDRAFLFADSESHGDGHKKIVIVGGIAEWPGANTLLGSLTNVPVECLGRDHMPFARSPAKIANVNDQQAGAMSTAVGLALRGMSVHE